MVKKLFKHEINAYLRTIIPMHMVLIGIAILSRFVQLFDNNSVSYNIVFYSSIVAFGIGVVVCIILTFVFGIRRFYTSLFTNEGYLSFTLPVSPTQHIIVKNIVAVMSQIAGFIMIFICACIATFGELCIELLKVVGYLIKADYLVYGQHEILFILEIILVAILVISTTYMLFYTCIVLGQRAKKNRALTTIGLSCVHFLATLIIVAIGIPIVEYFYCRLLWLFIPDGKILFANHLTMFIIVVISGLINLISFTIIKRSISRKLNLE